MIYRTLWSSSDKGFLCCFFYVSFFFFLFQTVEVAQAPAFQSEGGNVLQEGRASAAKSRTIPPPSLVTVWGIQSKVCPVTCSLRNKQQAESPKTKAIIGGWLARELNGGTFLKASIIEKL